MVASGTEEAPYGYICGFPTTTGDMYAGSMFCSSLDRSKQGDAIRRAEKTWGLDKKVASVCKARYQPFKKSDVDGSVEKMYGCGSHHAIRKSRIEKHGFRPGWIDFAQWHGSSWSYGTPSSKKRRRSGHSTPSSA